MTIAGHLSVTFRSALLKSSFFSKVVLFRSNMLLQVRHRLLPEKQEAHGLSNSYQVRPAWLL